MYSKLYLTLLRLQSMQRAVSDIYVLTCTTSMTRNIRIVPDHPTLMSVPAQFAHQEYDILILPGGGPGAKTFSTTDKVLELIG